MKRFLSILFVALFTCSLVVPSIALAETSVTINLEDLDSITRDSVLKKVKQLKEEKAKDITEKLANMDPDKVSQWTSTITKAIKDVCHDLNVEVNDFAKTPVGMGIVGIIVYKVVGADFVSSIKTVFFTLFWWFLVGSTIVLSFRHFHMCKKVKVKELDKKGKPFVANIEYIKRYKFNADDERNGSAVAHGIAFIAVNIVAIILLVS